MENDLDYYFNQFKNNENIENYSGFTEDLFCICKMICLKGYCGQNFRDMLDAIGNLGHSGETD